MRTASIRHPDEIRTLHLAPFKPNAWLQLRQHAAGIDSPDQGDERRSHGHPIRLIGLADARSWPAAPLRRFQVFHDMIVGWLCSDGYLGLSQRELYFLVEDGGQLEVDADEGEREVGHHGVVLARLDLAIHHVKVAHPVEAGADLRG